MTQENNYNQLRVCPMCGETKEGTHKFFTFKTGEEDCICKECLLKDVNDLNEETFIWLCKRYDIPYVESEYDLLVKRQIEKVIKYKTVYNTVFPKYLAKMKLMGYKSFTFKDSFRFCQNDAFKEYKREMEKLTNDSISV